MFLFPCTFIHERQTILRTLGEKYTYQAFIQELELQKRKFNPAQLSGLEQRLSILNSFIEKSSKSKSSKKRFAAGQLTIIDLSDPFIDPSSACGLFEIVSRLFVRADVQTGKILVVDEAHKVNSFKHASFAFYVLTSQLFIVLATHEVFRTDGYTTGFDSPTASSGDESHHKYSR